MVGGVIVLLLLCLSATASAQTPVGTEPAFSVERFTPAPGHAFAGTVEDPDVLPHLQWTAALWSSVAKRPIVLYDVMTGEEATVPVDRRLGFEAHAAVGLGRRYQLGVAIPWAAQDGERLQGTGLSEAALQRLVLGDVRLHARMRITGLAGDRGLGAALAGAVSLPTGDEDHLAGEAATLVEWKLVVGWRGERAAIAGNLGVRLRGQQVVLLSPARPHGNEIVTAIAGEVGLPWLSRVLTLGDSTRAWAVGELTKVTGDSIDAGARGASPGELRAGLRLAVADGWSVSALGGAGFTPDDVGSPRWRLAFGVTYDRAPSTTDLDEDGIIDARDRCRRAAEDVDGYEDRDGCPDADDDGDGIADELDKCTLSAEDKDGFDDDDGCPDTEVRVPLEPDPGLEPELPILRVP
jgi:hypothetical protein